jgi:tetratricopeptide (TPR) repeat protein
MVRCLVLLGSAIVVTAMACGSPNPPPHTEATLPDEPKAAPSGSAGTGGPRGQDPPELAQGTDAIGKKDYARAKSIFDKLAREYPKRADVRFYLGVSLENTGDKRGAIDSYQEALKLKPDLDEAAANASALMIDDGRFDDAIAFLEKLDVVNKKNASLSLNLAVAYASKDDRARAKNAFDAAAKIAPKVPLIWLTYGQWLGKWKEFPAATEKLKAAQKLAGDDVGMLASVGFELKNVGAFDECIAALDQAIALKDVAEIRTYRALCRLGLKDKKGSLDDLVAATKSDPKYAPAHFYLGGRYADAGDFKKAAECYETYLKLDPKGPLAKSAAERAKLARDKAKK